MAALRSLGPVLFVALTSSHALAASDDVPALEASAHAVVIDDANPSASIPPKEQRMKAPLQFGYLLMELTDRATKSLEEKDFARAARYYEAIVSVAPERSVGYAKLCESCAGLKDAQRALDACRTALGKEGVQVSDHARFLTLLLQSKQQLDAAEVEEADAILTHLREQNVDSRGIYELECELGVRTQSQDHLKRCTEGLERLAPQHPKAITYAWALAMLQGDRGRASELVERARAAGLAPETLQRMAETTEARGGGRMAGRLLLLGSVLAAVAAFAVVMWRKSRREQLTA